MKPKIFTGKSYKYKIGFIGGGVDSLIGEPRLFPVDQ